MFAKIYNNFLNKGKDKKFRIGHSSRATYNVTHYHLILEFFNIEFISMIVFFFSQTIIYHVKERLK